MIDNVKDELDNLEHTIEVLDTIAKYKKQVQDIEEKCKVYGLIHNVKNELDSIQHNIEVLDTIAKYKKIEGKEEECTVYELLHNVKDELDNLEHTIEVLDTIAKYKKQVQDIEEECKVYGLLHNEKIYELLNLSYREIKYCESLKVYSNNLDWYISKLRKTINICRNSFVGVPIRHDDLSKNSSNIDTYLVWIRDILPTLSKDDIINYVKNNEPANIIFTYLLYGMNDEQVDTEILIKLMALSSGFNKYIQNDDDYYAIFYAQRIRYTLNNIEDILKYLYSYNNNYYIKVSKKYINLKCIIDRMDFSSITQTSKRDNSFEFASMLDIHELPGIFNDNIHLLNLKDNLDTLKTAIKNEEDISNILRENNIIKKTDNEEDFDITKTWIINNIDNMDELIKQKYSDINKRKVSAAKEDGLRVRINYIRDNFGDRIKTISNPSKSKLINETPKFW